MSEQPEEGANGSGHVDEASRGGSWTGRGRVLAAVGAALAVVAAALVAVLLWRPWEPTCSRDDAHVVDEEAEVCYEIPEGWRRETADETANAAAYGRPGGSSVVSPQTEPESGERLTWVWALEFAYEDQEEGGDAVTETFARIKAAGEDPKDESSVEKMAKALARIQVPTGSVDVDVHRVDGVPVASATASGPGEGEGADGYQWARVTVAPGKSGYAFVLSVTGASSKAKLSDSVIEDYNQVHDSVVPIG
jgi:hypothetical protein